MEVDLSSRPLPDIIVHHGTVKAGKLRVGDILTLKVDPLRRGKTMLNHTATHLLQAALRQVLGGHVKQAGSLVAPERLRFDYTHFSPLTDEEVDRVEEIVNSRIRQNLEVGISILPYKEALERGAMALFGEKYGDRVRLVQVGEASAELCGGTHSRRSGDIGLFKIASETGVAAGVSPHRSGHGGRSLEGLQARGRRTPGHRGRTEGQTRRSGRTGTATHPAAKRNRESLSRIAGQNFFRSVAGFDPYRPRCQRNPGPFHTGGSERSQKPAADGGSSEGSNPLRNNPPGCHGGWQSHAALCRNAGSIREISGTKIDPRSGPICRRYGRGTTRYGAGGGNKRRRVKAGFGKDLRDHLNWNLRGLSRAGHPRFLVLLLILLLFLFLLFESPHVPFSSAPPWQSPFGTWP